MDSWEDEIEYFGFLPSTFTADLQQILEAALAEILHGREALPGKVVTQLEDSLKKNIFIFNNFVLRNILKFPPNFRLERKITDKWIEGNLQEALSSFQDKHAELEELRSKYQRVENGLERERDISSGYKALLADSDKYEEMIAAATQVKEFMKETERSLGAYMMTNPGKEREFDNLMEFKNIKNEYYKEERDRLFGVASIDVLESMERMVMQ